MDRFHALPMTRLPHPHTLALQPTTPVDTPGPVFIRSGFREHLLCLCPHAPDSASPLTVRLCQHIFAQGKLARDHYTDTFTLNSMVPSTIYAPVPIAQNIVVRLEVESGSLFPWSADVFCRDSTPNPSVPIMIGGVLGGIAFLLLIAAMAYFLWRMRQGRTHLERIHLADIVPRMSFSASSPRRR